MALLNKDQIWQADDRNYSDVPVPEWGGVVRLRGLTGAERDAFEAQSIMQVKGERQVNHRNLRARLIAACAIDEDGNPVFDKSDVIHLGTKSAVPLERLFDEAMKLSGMRQEDIDELTENLENGQSDSSTSA